MKRQFKVAVGGETASRMARASGEEWLTDARVTPIVFVVEVESPGRPPRGELSPQGTDAYFLEVAELDDGTFPDLRVKEVTGTGWQVF